ncbi:MAG: radical SAM protein [Anaerolineae bacterium]|nr:radical SAM protein [Anaerolineae bacterium]
MIANKNNPFLDIIAAGVNEFKTALDPLRPPEIGLHAYDVGLQNGGKMRIHLRVEPQGQGVLFVDVTDVVHLNASATLIVKMALDEVPLSIARSKFLFAYGAGAFEKINRDLSQLYQMVDQFRQPTGECPTCMLDGAIDMQPLFSIGVNAPYKVDLALTYGCNNECPHCYNEADRLAMPSLPFEEWKKILDKIAAMGVPHVILTGGEATLHPDLPDIIHYADQLGMIVGLNTNGRHIAQEAYMQALADAGLNHVQVTLGSHLADVHNEMMGAQSFNQTVRGIRNAVASNVHVITNTTLMRSNMEAAEEIIDFLYDLGIRTFAMNGMIYSGGGFEHPLAIKEEEMPPLLIRVRDHAQKLGMRFLWYTPTEYCRMSPVELEIGAKRCNAGEYSMCIEPNGDVLPCQSYYVSAGNILSNEWASIWDGELFRSFRDREADPEWAGLPEKCWHCPDLALCGGGCRIEREARDGVRISEGGGGGCSGCSGSCGSGEAASVVRELYPTAGYIPVPGQVKSSKRTSGKLTLIAADDIK